MIAAERTVWQSLLGMVWPKPVSVRYAAGLLLAVMRLVVAFVAGVEAIFITDLVISHILPHVLDHRASLTNVVVLVGEAMPSSIYIALPVAVLAAVYFVLLRRREAREFIVLAGMGRGVGPIIGFAAVVGVVGLLLSLFLSGYVEPLARYAMTRTMSDVRVEAIRNSAIGAGKFFKIADYTVFAGGGQTNRVADKVFILEERDGDGYRLLTASQSQRLFDPAMIKAGVILHNAGIYDFIVRNPDPAADCEQCQGLQIVPAGARASSQVFVDVPSLSLPEIEPRGTRVAERTDFELIAGDLGDEPIRRALGERLFRALLVFVVPLLALLAVALTRPALFLVALPGAAMLVLAGSFFGSRLIEELMPLGFAGMAAALLAGAAALTGLIIGLILRFANGCIQHGGVQP